MNNYVRRYKMTNMFEKTLLGVLVVFLVLGSAVFISAGGLGIFGEEDARAKALELVPGVVTEVDVENKNGELIYEVDVSNENGDKEVTFDSEGNLLGVENEEADKPITGKPLEIASQVALDYIGEGRVTDTEIGDEEGYYEIEITLDGGREVDVHLDEDFNVLSTEYD
jgi:uncharacterized membrane protein YkoI